MATSTGRVCWICEERDSVENLEPEPRGTRTRWAHLSCREEAAILLEDFLKYEAPYIQEKALRKAAPG
jgi:hypothetical protein